MVSKRQIDLLGQRLRAGNPSEEDLRLLDQYRLSFAPAYEEVVARIRRELKLEPTGRPTKSTTSIVEKLRRESIRLTQIQDIAGCRLIVPSLNDQERVLLAIQEVFRNVVLVDRRKSPSHGYRAVHLIVRDEDSAVEIQVRTELQHSWAELSEKLSDLVDPAVKYGGGDESIVKLLQSASSLVEKQELAERKLAETRTKLSLLSSKGKLTPDLAKKLRAFQIEVDEAETTIVESGKNSFKLLQNMLLEAEEALRRPQ